MKLHGIVFRAAVSVVALTLAGCAAVGSPGTVEPTPQSSAAAPVSSGSEQDQLDGYWGFVTSQFPNAVRPEVARIRFVTPEEWPQTQADCLHESGFPDVVVLPDGGIEPEGLTDAQMESYLMARYTCTAMYPIDPKFTAPLTPEQIGAVYDYYLDDLIPCLEAEGYAVPEPPSRALFLDTYLTDQWQPYTEVFTGANVSQDEFYRVSQKCPQWPSDLYG